MKARKRKMWKIPGTHHDSSHQWHLDREVFALPLSYHHRPLCFYFCVESNHPRLSLCRHKLACCPTTTYVAVVTWQNKQSTLTKSILDLYMKGWRRVSVTKILLWQYCNELKLPKPVSPIAPQLMEWWTLIVILDTFSEDKLFRPSAMSGCQLFKQTKSFGPS